MRITMLFALFLMVLLMVLHTRIGKLEQRVNYLEQMCIYRK